MALIDLRIDLTRVARALERLADAAERISPPLIIHRSERPAEFINVNPADIADAEAEADRKRKAGTEESYG